MAGKPWEKFKAKEEAPAAGPWQKFAQDAPEEPGAEEDFLGTQAVVKESIRRRPKNASDLRAMARAAHAGIAQAVTAGHTPEIVGKITSGVSDRPYVEVRDEQSKELEEIRKDAPWTYNVANLGANLLLPLKAGKTLPRAMGIGALQGAVQNPGNEEGVVDPLQLGRRSIGAGIGATFSGGANLVGKGLGAAGRAHIVKRAMQKPFFSRNLKEEIDLAGEELSKNYITPRAKAAREGLKGKNVEVKVGILDGADEPGLQAALRKRSRGAQRDAAHAPFAGSSGNRQPQVDDDIVDMDAAVADRVRKMLDKRGKYKTKTAYGNAEAMKGGEGKIKAADILRGQRERVAPELSQNFDEQEQALGILGDVRRGSSNPQTMMNASGDMESKLIDFDHLTGTTNLTRMGRDLKAANYLTNRGERAGLDMLPGVNATARAGARVGAAMASPVAIAQELSEKYAPKMMQRKLSPAALRLMLERIRTSPRYPEEEEQE